MRITFFSHYFPPEGNAPATRVYELCRRWCAAGHEVTVITGVPNVPQGVVYAGYRNRLLQRETVDGIRVTRAWTYIAPNKGTLRRTLNYVSYMGSATLAALAGARPEVIIATSPQFFCGWAGAFAQGLRRTRFILEIRDIWPESIVTVGAMKEGPAIRMLQGLERLLYRAADRIVTVGEGYRDRLAERGVPTGRIDVIPNGVDSSVFYPRERDAGLADRLGLGHRFVCSTIGTIGMASGLDVVLRAARILKSKGRSDICFLLVGDGAVRRELEEQAAAQNLDNVRFTGLQPKSMMPAFLSLSDACLIHLRRKELFRSVLPSKIFEASAMARPILIGVEGFAADLVTNAGAGLPIEPDNEHSLVDAVERLAAAPALRAELGEAGRRNIAARHDWDSLAARYLHVIRAVAAPP